MAGASYQKHYRKLVKEVTGWMCHDDSAEQSNAKPPNLLAQNQPEEDRSTGIGICDADSDNESLHSAGTSDFEPLALDSDTPPLNSEDECDFADESLLQSDKDKWVVDAHITLEDCNRLLDILRKHGHFILTERSSRMSAHRMQVSTSPLHSATCSLTVDSITLAEACTSHGDNSRRLPFWLRCCFSAAASRQIQDHSVSRRL